MLGTFNSGCAKLEIPILNRAPGGPVAMISSANTAVGLTHYAPWNDPGEPNIYYPTKIRNYVRVAASDDFQGPFVADLLKKLKKKSVYILHDNQTFGKGVANGFRSRANKLDIKVLGLRAVGREGHELRGDRSADQGHRRPVRLPRRLVCNNGVKLLKDLRSVLGKGVMRRPRRLDADSATLAAGAAAQGMYITYAGQPLATLGPKGKAFLAGRRSTRS